MKVLVIGASGQLGSDVCRAFEGAGDEAFGATHADVEVRSADSVVTLIRSVGPEVVVNTSAMHHVESCESDAEGAFAVNGLGARNLALACGEMGAVLIHVSTDYVFAGDKKSPYVESDLPCPLNVYGTTKLAGECFVRSILEKYFIVRTSALYGCFPCRAKGGLNFVELMLKLAREGKEIRVVDSESVSPTFTMELARHIVCLSRGESYGLYHATAEGSCSWYEFAQEIFSLSNIRPQLMAARAGEFAGTVRRPSYSVLDNAALKTRGMNTFRSWKEGLREYLHARTGEVFSEAKGESAVLDSMGRKSPNLPLA